MTHFMNKQIALLVLLITLFMPTYAQNIGQDKLNEKYALKEVVVLSRHNIRAPLSTSGSALSKATTKKWIDWSAKASELTLKGGVLETMMGQYFRKWSEAQGLFPVDYCPNTDDVNVYANSMQRTIATARYFTTGFFPTCQVNINHRFSPSKMDPVFFPRLTKVSDNFKEKAMKEINALGGDKGIAGLSESLKPSYKLVEKVIDMKNSPLCKEGKICELNDYNTPIKLNIGDEPRLSGSLGLGTQIADALILQYYEETNDQKADFGNKLNNKDWEEISKLKDVYGDVLFGTPTVAANVAHPLLVYMKDELQASNRKFSFLVGHDSNVCSVTSALGFETYSLPNTIEKKTPIGCKLVFEKWEDKATKKVYVRVNMVYQTTDQLRKIMPLGLSTPPAIFPMKISGLNMNEEGLYNFNDLMDRFNQAISSYEDIK